MTPGVVAETDLAGTLKSEYVFFDGERVARRDGPTGTGGVFYYFSDHLKTASVITDSAGVIKAESDYYPWGGELQFVNNDSNDYKFTGKKRDAETGLDYFGARYYSNGLGRFVSADWSAVPVPVPYADLSNPQTLDQYAYVHNNPMTFGDPDGHDGGAGVLEKAVEYVEDGLAKLVNSAEGAAGPVGETAAGVSASAIVTGVAVVLVPATIWAPSAGQSNADERAAMQQASQERAQQNGGVDPQTEHTPEPAPASGGAMKGGGDKPGEVYVTEPQVSGKPYVGRTTQGTDKRMQTRTDGRTGQAKTIDTYKTRQQGRYKEQKAIDQRGGKQNLDNKRNEVSPKKMKELNKKYGGAQ